ncbi:BirA family transcriptional regulator, biotin operon repressor / biotin-[acetyl-CoA-carboxylase] ligase [Desulfoluna spongiiphila]|uniref:BirA family transcriptional regulator, biotin operon repressor / biotin-[acetyl-CoA-carboxylase] ligase n=2 Tax=Desulfoluna spongiiphila TaxID=419481 RepID=A0A1G5IZK6_9BACT|nr:BirA family transcriptional regulator, biotin operon repressor / biotin-[acetyl-CoA-carboxylase] ligase [Desulfoluna spongiiphila]
MADTILWGTGIEDVAEGVGPGQLRDMSRVCGPDVESPLHWRPACLVSEGPRSRCWVSGKGENLPVFVTGPCASSMKLAWCFHRKNLLPEWVSVLAESQWAGKGQLGRQWHSPAGNIYGTMRLPSSALLEEDCLPLLVGYALVTALGAKGVTVKLKWPNDLVMGNKKVGGILIEEKGGVRMVGVGINLTSSPPEEKLRSDNALAAACLKDVGHGDLSPLPLWRHLVTTIRDILNTVTASDLPALMARLHSHLAFAGDKVRVEDYANPPYEAKILGLSSNGGLKLLTRSGTTVVRSASIYPIVCLT